MYGSVNDIVVLKNAHPSWRDDEGKGNFNFLGKAPLLIFADLSVEDRLSQVTQSSLDVNVGSVKSASEENGRYRMKKNLVPLMNCVSDSYEDRIGKWVRNGGAKGDGSINIAVNYNILN